MGCKWEFINGRAVGYWGRDIRCRIAGEFLADKVMAQNADMLTAMGLPFAIWREATSVQTGLTTCSCFKETAKQPDIPCLSCYGTGAIPGYLKFGTRNYWTASIDPGWTLTNIVLDKTNRPHRFMLDVGSVSGTAISPNLTISVTGKLGPWEAKADGFTRDGGVDSTIDVEASKDNGVTWFPLANIESQAPTTQLRFRVTMTRTSVAVKSPFFEIIRARYPYILDFVDVKAVNEPVIRFIPTWDDEQEHKQNIGLKTENAGKKFWTIPLTFFDPTLARETMAARLADDCIAEARYGGNIGIRFSFNEFKYSDTFGEFTRQEFELRRVIGKPGQLHGEVYYRIF